MSDTNPPNSATPAGGARFGRESLGFRCPQCGASASVQVHSIVDVSDSQARRRLVDGLLNAVRCPSCGLTSRMATPVLYHDAAHDIAYVFVPQALQLAHTEQEAAVGRLTNRLMDKLPPEERRMYLLQPKLFLGEPAFLDAVREAPPSPVPTGAAARPATPDAAGRPASADGAPREAEDGLGSGQPIQVDFDTVVAALKEARAEGALHEAVAELRALLDYPFFIELTDQIEALRAEGRTEAADELLGLRASLVEAIDQVDSTTRAALDEALKVVRRVFESQDPAAELEALPLEAFNDAFFLVLSSNARAAEESGEHELADRFRTLTEMAAQALEAKLPPMQRLISQLARADDDDQRSELLAAEPSLWGEDLQTALYHTAASARASGAPDVADNLSAAGQLLGDRLRHQREPA